MSSGLPRRDLRYYDKSTNLEGAPEVRDEEQSARKHTRWIYEDTVLDSTGRLKLSHPHEPESAHREGYLINEDVVSVTARGKKAWKKRKQQLSRPKDFSLAPTAAEPYQYDPLPST